MEARYRLAKLAKDEGNAARELALMKEIFQADQAAAAARTERTRYLGATRRWRSRSRRTRSTARLRWSSRWQRQLKLKKAKMEAVLKAYAAAADYGVADVATAATFRTAELYQDFGKALMTSQRPKGLSKVELEQYNVLLEEQAFPFEEKAIELHELNARRTANGIYDKWVKDSYRGAAPAAARALRQDREHCRSHRCDPLSPWPVLPRPAGAHGGRLRDRAVRAAAGRRRLDGEHRAARCNAGGEGTGARRERRGAGEARRCGSRGRPGRAARLRRRAPGTGRRPARRGRARFRGTDDIASGPRRPTRQPRPDLPAGEQARRRRDRLRTRGEGQSDGRRSTSTSSASPIATPASSTRRSVAYEQAIDADPAYAPAQLNLGVLYDLYLWDAARALEHYDRYLALTTDNDDKVKRWVAELRRRTAPKAQPSLASREGRK